MSTPDFRSFQSGERSAWRERLYARFRGQPAPLLVFPDHLIPAASLWTGARRWIAAFRQAGLHPGDRIAIALPPSAAFLQVLLAGLWEGLTLALLAPSDGPAGFLEPLDARGGVSLGGGQFQWRPDGVSGPAEASISLRPAHGLRTPDARLLLRPSETTAAPRWIAFSDCNLLSALDTYRPYLARDGSCVLSVLPWHQAFGLLSDLLPALMAGATVVRDPDGGDNTLGMAAQMAAWEVTHVTLVPEIAQRLWGDDAGRAALRGLHGGVVGLSGSSPISAALANVLRQTRLRASYGHTEAVPGIAEGDPGVWEAGYLGHRLGCEIKIAPDQSLWFRGPTACLGRWHDGILHREAPDRWVNTGDAVRQVGDDLFLVVSS